MRSRRVLVFAGVVGLALVGLLITMTADKRDLAFTLGVQPQQAAAVLNPGQEVCQRPIDVPDNAASVDFQVGTFGRPGPALRAAVRSQGRPSSSAVLPGGYADSSRQRVRIGGIEAGKRISVCIRDLGKHRVSVYGSAAQAGESVAFLGAQQLPASLALVFHRSSPRSASSLVPSIFQRAALFRPGWAGDWIFWFLGVLLITAAPAALAFALAGAAPRD